MTSSGDWNDIIDNAEAECFVGREQELNIFRQEIGCTPPRYLVFYITGQGGVGKSTLLNRYQEMAKERGFLILDADEQQHDVPAVLARFAHQAEHKEDGRAGTGLPSSNLSLTRYGLQFVALVDPVVPIFNGLLGLLIYLEALQLAPDFSPQFSLGKRE